MNVVFITGTNTDVGKTIATASAIAATNKARPGLRIGVMKPAQTGIPAVPAEDLGNWDKGDRGDLAVIKRTVPNIPLAVFEHVRYPEPLAPDLAGRRADMPLYTAEDFASAISVAAQNLDVLFVEGAGGLLVGLGQASSGEPITLVDIATATVAQNPQLEASVALVSQPDLGMLNECLLSTREIKRAGLKANGIIFGTWPEEPDLAMRLNQDEVVRLTGIPVLARIPKGVGVISTGDCGKETVVEKDSGTWWQQLPWLV